MFKLFSGLLALLFSFHAFAGVIISGTRVIYDGDKREAIVAINNPDKQPYLIQTWIENFSGTVSSGDKTPFIITPPLFRLNEDAAASIRIVKDGVLPSDKESAFWLNIKSIPTSSPDAKNQLLVSVNTRIKLFYRPSSLSSKDALNAGSKLMFTSSGKTIIAKNATPFFVSLSALKINGTDIDEPGMISPFSEKQWVIPTLNSNDSLKVHWSVINDYGGIDSYNHQ